MHSNNSGQSTGCGISPQTTVDEMQQQIIASSIEKQAEIAEKQYVEKILPNSSPIKIPLNASIKDEYKAAGYRQIKYRWNYGEYNYTSRWHEKTPNAPKDQGSTWVVERKRKGIGYGPNVRPKIVEVLVGKYANGQNIWVNKKLWKEAIAARKNGTATQKQKEMLDNGHWKSKE